MNPDANFGSKQKSPGPPFTEAPPRHDVRGASVQEDEEQSWLQTEVAVAPLPHVMQTWPSAHGAVHAGENVVHTPAWQVTAFAPLATMEPSSAMIADRPKLISVG